ncbi:MAG: hypothetical protein AAF513_18470 [Pseudomonadota bacterium]
MQVMGIRFCSVDAQSESMSAFFSALGLQPVDPASNHVFAAGNGWIETWAATEDMPAGVMLQIVVDDADEFAAHARSNQLDPQGPVEAHGEKIYFLQAPSGLNITIQSALA